MNTNDNIYHLFFSYTYLYLYIFMYMHDPITTTFLETLKQEEI
jgi:hypothetical protein